LLQQLFLNHDLFLLDNFVDPKFNIDNTTVYGDDSTIKHEFKNGKIYSIYRKNYAFISNKDFTIPAITLKAYNPKTLKIYTLKTEPIDIKIIKNRTIEDILNSSENSKNLINKKSTIHKKAIIKKESFTSIETKVNEVNKIEDIILDKNYYKKKYSKKIDFKYLMLVFLSGIILGGFIVALFFEKIKNRLFTNPKKLLYGSYQEALNILYPHIGKDAKIEEMVKLLYEVINGNKEIKINEKQLRKMVKKIKKGKYD